ncbi:MAG: hypothetical protein R2861_16685 [Desulfobacterales bacterium]
MYFHEFEFAANFNQVIKKIHDKSRVQQEILKNTSIFEDLYAFSFTARSMVIYFSKSANSIMSTAKLSIFCCPSMKNYDDVPAYKKQEWFYCKLAGEPLETDDKGLDAVFFQDLNELIDILMEEICRGAPVSGAF